LTDCIQVAEAKTEKRKLAEGEVKNLIAKKSRMEKDIEALVKSADAFAMQAEESSDLSLIAKSNSMRKSSKEKRVQLSTVQKQLADKQQELLNI